MDVKDYINLIIQQLENEFPQETEERKQAKTIAINKISKILNEFNNLSKNIGTNQEQLSAISQLQKILFQLGKIKTPEK